MARFCLKKFCSPNRFSPFSDEGFDISPQPMLRKNTKSDKTTDKLIDSLVTKGMGYKPRLLRRLFLILYILFQHLNRRTSYGTGKVGRTPKSFFVWFRVSCLPISTARDSFECVHNLRNGKLWRILHNHMNVIGCPKGKGSRSLEFAGLLNGRSLCNL